MMGVDQTRTVRSIRNTFYHPKRLPYIFMCNKIIRRGTLSLIEPSMRTV